MVTFLPSEPTALPYRAEVKRKMLHVLALVVPLGMWRLGIPEALYALVPLSLLSLGGDVLRAYSSGFNRFIRFAFGPVMRYHELPPCGHGIAINGATWVLISATVLAVVFPLYIAVAIFTMFMVSDAVAALVGRRWGRRYWGGGPRTVEGSVAFLLTGLGVIACFSSIPFISGAAGVTAACIAEAFPRPGNDNLRVPIAGAVVIVIIQSLLVEETIPLFLGLIDL